MSTGQDLIEHKEPKIMAQQQWPTARLHSPPNVKISMYVSVSEEAITLELAGAHAPPVGASWTQP